VVLLVEFFDWWRGQLVELIPEGWREPAGGADALIVDTSEPGTLKLLRRRRGVLARLAQVQRDDNAMPSLRQALANRPRTEPVLLRIPAAMVLERVVNLPLAAERDLGRVLGYEMERLTPFSADEVIWDTALQARDRARSRLVVRLTMVPRAALAPLFAQLRDQSLVPEALEADLPDGVRVLRLARQATSRVAALSTRNLGIAAAVLLLLVLVTPFLRQSLELADLDDRLALLAPRIAQVEQLRKRITGSGAGGDAVAAETRRLGDALEALAAITEILPDDSYLTEFTMRERKMTLSGLGASAPRLISGLSADPRIRNPAFTAPVTRQEQGRIGIGIQEAAPRDVFSIRAELAP
jgi:general secretion pathway protein L